MVKLRVWAQQPTTVAGFSALVATITALMLKQLTWAQAIPLIAGAVASMALPDNTGAGAEAQQLTSQLVAKIMTKEEIKK